MLGDSPGFVLIHRASKKKLVKNTFIIQIEYDLGEWRSLVAHLLWEQRVAGSNPVSPTNSKK